MLLRSEIDRLEAQLIQLQMKMADMEDELNKLKGKSEHQIACKTIHENVDLSQLHGNQYNVKRF